MIKGLYEAHLPVSNLEVSIEFYEKLGLKMAWQDEETAFFWMEEGRSWIGIWEGKEAETPYHPSLRHIAFRVTYEDLKQSLQWLKSIGIDAVPFRNRTSIEPFIRAYQGNASVYFNDPDGNSLELMCHVEVPEHLKHISENITFTEWEELLEQK